MRPGQLSADGHMATSLVLVRSASARAELPRSRQRAQQKGTADARPELGWAFSLSLVDRGIYGYVPEQPKPEGKVPEGVDAL